MFVKYIENSMSSLIPYCTGLCCVIIAYILIAHLTRIYCRDTQQSDEVGAMVGLRPCISGDLMPSSVFQHQECRRCADIHAGKIAHAHKIK